MALASALAVVMAQGAMAQEVHLNGLGWIKANPGSVIDEDTRVVVDGNRAESLVRATGGSASAVGNVAGRLRLISVAQANSAGLGAVEADNVWVRVLRNQLTGSVESVGGAATANVALISGGDVRREFKSSRIDVLENHAGRVKAVGAEGDVLLGAIGSFQLPGRASANSALIAESDVRNIYAVLNANVADRVNSVGGAALANALTVAQSKVRDAGFFLDRNQADNVTASGGEAYVGAGLLASVELTGASLANSVAVAQSELKGGQFLASNNQASQISSVGGSALANSTNVMGSSNVGFKTQQVGNHASQVSASGGTGSLLAGALADVNKSATALANAISVTSPVAGSSHAHVQVGNQASQVIANGGGAAANSVWVQGANMRGSGATLLDNEASQVTVSGGSVSVGAGALADFARQGRALANSVVLDQGAEMADAPSTLSRNVATGVRGEGGLAAGNSVLVSSQSKVSGAPVTVYDNRAQDVSATGFKDSVGAGLIASATQKSLALANTLAAFASHVTGVVTLVGNRVVALISHGGTAQANSASVERGEGAASQLNGAVAITGNQARSVSTGASSSSGPAHVFSTEMEARAAANALVLKDGAMLSSAGKLSIADNTASFLQAVGGTVLVNSLALYRGATVTAPVNLRSNVAEYVSAGGGSSQVAGVGSNKNGVVAVNGLYLDGGETGAVSLRNSPATLSENTASHIDANGGRINVNALAINGAGSISGSPFIALGNTARRVTSVGEEGTVMGFAAFDRGVGHANANALQVLGGVADSTVRLMSNQATDVHAEKGLAAANSVLVDQGGNITSGSTVDLVRNEASNVRATDGKTALANSLLAEGRMEGGSATAMANVVTRAESGGDDAQASSIRVKKGASQTRASAVVAANHADVRGGGTANSVVLDRGGSVQNGGVSILGNQATVRNGGVANSVRSEGAIVNSQITILGNQGTVQSGGTVNGVDNSGRIENAHILIAANQGEARGGGLVNSVHNRGQLTGRISIIGNRGTAMGGGTVNSVVNNGKLVGAVTIAGNVGSAGMGGTSNSLINHGVITGKVSIVGNASAAAPGMVTASVRNMSALTGSAGVSAGVPSVANPGMDVTLPNAGVISNTVTVLPGYNLRNM